MGSRVHSYYNLLVVCNPSSVLEQIEQVRYGAVVNVM